MVKEKKRLEEIKKKEIEMKKQRLQRMQKIAQKVIRELKRDKRTLGIILIGSLVTKEIWEESDIDLVRIVKGKGKPCRWKWIEGIRVEITDIPLIDWMKKKKEVDLGTEIYLSSLNAVKIVYDPKGIVKRKLQKFTYSTELKLFLILQELAAAIRYIKSARKCLALKKYYSCYENLRQAIISLGASLFALNKKARKISKIEDIGVIHYWLDEFEKLKRRPRNFSHIYKKVLSSKVSKDDQIRICKRLWEIFREVVNFSKNDIKNCIKELGGFEKVKKKLKLNHLQLEVIKNLKEKI